MRFRFPAKYAMRIVNKPGSKVLAYFTIIDSEIGIEFRDVRLMLSKSGDKFVAAPFRDYEKNGQKQYADFWRAAWDEDAGERDERGIAYLEDMLKAATDLYEKISGGESTEDGAPRRSSGASKGGAKRSARGPVPKTAAPTVEEDEDDDLPF